MNLIKCASFREIARIAVLDAKFCSAMIRFKAEASKRGLGRAVTRKASRIFFSFPLLHLSLLCPFFGLRPNFLGISQHSLASKLHLLCRLLACLADGSEIWCGFDDGARGARFLLRACASSKSRSILLSK